MKILFGLLLAFSIGAVTRVAGIPVPAPPAIIGTLLVLAMTPGYVITDKYAGHRDHFQKDNCGGPTGQTKGGPNA